jgi:hypothetical protein
VPQGKLLGFIVSHQGIEANLKKITAITAMHAPRTIKDVQKLTDCMAALNRFLPTWRMGINLVQIAQSPDLEYEALLHGLCLVASLGIK